MLMVSQEREKLIGADMTKSDEEHMLPASIMDVVDDFYGLPDDLFAKTVGQLTEVDPRLTLLFFATRQRVQQYRAALKDV